MESTEASQSTPIRSNYLFNPAFRAMAAKPTVLRENMMTNPSMETAGASVVVRENLLPNPGVERTNGTLVVRTNYSTNPRGTGEFQKYANAAITQTTVEVTDNPDGIATATRVTYTGTGSNPGVSILSAAEVGTTYTMSAWVYHESVTSAPGQAGFAQAGVTSKGHDYELNKWVRYSWTYTASSTNLLGYRIGGQSGSGTGSFLITGVLVEKTDELLPFFDHTTPADTSFTYAQTTQGHSQKVAILPSSFGNNTNASRVWQSADVAYTGTKSLRCESTSATGTGNGINTHIMGLPIGTYTFSAYVYMSSLYGQGLIAAARGAGDDTLYRSSSTVVLNNWSRVSITFKVTTVGDTWLYVIATGSSTAPVGSFFYADAFMLEKSDTLNPYFDAGTPRQNLVSNSNFATGTKGWGHAGTGNASIFHDTSVTYHGGASLRVETNGAAANQGAYTTTRQDVRTSRDYTVSVWVRGTKGNRLLLEYAELDAAVTDVASRSRIWYTLTSDDWEKISLTRTMSDKAVTSQVLVRVPTDAVNTFWVGAVLVEAGDQQSEFYDGTGDFTYAWSGVADSSSSLQSALSVPDITSTNVLTYRSGAKAHSGAYSLYVTGSGTAQNTHAAPIVLNTVIGTKYTVSAWVYLMEDSVNVELQVSGIPADDITGVANVRGKWVRLSQVVTATGTTHMIRIRTRAAGRAHFFIDDVLFETGISLQPYFDGSTGPDNGLEHAWTGTAHASTSTRSGALAVGQHLLYRDTESPHGRFWGYRAFDNGTPVARWVAPAGTPSTSWRVACWGYTAMEHSKIMEGKTYTVLFKYRSWGWGTTAPRNGLQISTASSANHVLSPTTTPKVQLDNPEWAEYRHTFTALRTSENTQMIYFSLPATPPADSDGVLEVKETALIDGVYDGPYFDGTTDLKDSDLSCGWTATTDGSTSVIKGAAVTGQTLTLTHGAAISSTMWKWSGSKSMRIIAQNSGSVDSFVDIKGMVDQSALKPNTTYTISGIRYQRNVLAGTVNLRGFRVNLGGNELTVTGGVAQNTVGPQTISATFTTGETIAGNYSYIRLYNGSKGGNGDVWWDDICLSEGDNGTRYVDGTMREARWTGAAHASESVGYTETLESLVGSPIFMYDTPGSRKLDPTVLSEDSPRTFYSIIYSEKVVGVGVVDGSVTYGIDPLGDQTPNKTLTIRMQPGSGEWNNLLVRRTNGLGAMMSGVPAPGYSISYGGLNEQGNLFAGRYGVAKLVTDTVQMSIPHQAIKIEADNSTHRHVATYLFRGMHDEYTREKVSKLLAIKHGLPELL